MLAIPAVLEWEVDVQYCVGKFEERPSDLPAILQFELMV